MDNSTAGTSGLKSEQVDDSVDDDSVFESGSNQDPVNVSGTDYVTDFFYLTWFIYRFVQLKTVRTMWVKKLI